MTVDHRRLLVFMPALAEELGLNEAIILQQILYWLPRSSTERGGRKWVYKTIEEWAVEFPFWSKATIKRAIAKLVAGKLVDISKESSTAWNRKNFYSVNSDDLKSLIRRIGADCTDALAQIEPNEERKLRRSIGSDCTDPSGQIDLITLTTESTSEITPPAAARRKGPKRARYQPPAAADLKFPRQTPEKAQRAYLAVAEQHQLTREQLQLAFDEVDDRLARREPVKNPVLLVRAIAGQMRAGTFYGARAERHAQAERGGGRPLSAEELEFASKQRRVA